MLAPGPDAPAAFLVLAPGLFLGPSPLPTAFWERTRALGETVFRVSLVWPGDDEEEEETHVYLEVLWAPVVRLSLGDSFLDGVLFTLAVDGPLLGVPVFETEEGTETVCLPVDRGRGPLCSGPTFSLFTQVNFELLTEAWAASARLG